MSKILELPQISAEFSYELPAQQVVLVSGGEAPEAAWLKQILDNRVLWCADHGVDACKRAQCLPEYLVGDADSATPEAWKWAEVNGTKINKVPIKKDMTDTQLALQMIHSEYHDPFTIMTGAWGGRFDHAFSAIFSFQGIYKDISAKILGCIADQKEALFFLHNEDRLTLNLKQAPKAISLLPLSGECTGVSIDGVYWPLEQVMLNNNLPYAISNEVSDNENKIWISQKRGLLGVYIFWDV